MKINPSKDRVWFMFDRIANRYDLLNRLLSLGQDVVWRKRVAALLPNQPGQHVLDLATGTADQIIHLCKKNTNISFASGMDMSAKMLEIGRKKIIRKKLDHIIKLEIGNAMKIPSAENSFDVVTISFGIRNADDVTQVMCEMYRILKPGGRAIILEFSLPKNKIIRSFYLFYFRYILPFVGSVISNDSYAYRYLNQTVEIFPYAETFCKLMATAGFQDVKSTPLTFGIATIYQGAKHRTQFLS